MMYTNKQLLKLTLPLFAEQFLIVFVGVADTFMVSYAGEAAVSGVALVDTISFLITAVLGALCTGGAVVASQYLGSGDRQKVALTGRLLLGGALLIGLVILAGVELLGAPALRLIFGNVEADVMQSARDYFRIVGVSYPFLAVYSAAPPAPSPMMRMNQKLPATLMRLTTRLETIEIMLLPWLR